MMYRRVKIGETVWSLPKGNGIITDIDYPSRTVFVNHYDNGRAEYDFDELLGTYDERLNQYVISPIC